MSGEAASIATPFQARTETLLTLRQLASPPAALSAIVATEPDDATEYVARKVIALAASGQDVSTTLNVLLSLQNSDGGFGGDVGYSSNALDTSFALLAFKSAGTNNTATAAALAYLGSVQSADGSFAINEQPSIYVTALGLQALNAFSTSSSLAARITSARTWLAAQQVSGAYSTVLDNSLAAIAIAGSTTDSALFAGSQSSLKGAQSPDGSWNGDPYLTAIAIRALVATASAVPPATTGSISGTVVDALSGTAISGASVQISGPTAVTVTTSAAGTFSADALVPGAYTVQVAQSGYATLNTTLTVTAGSVSSLGTIRLPAANTSASLQGTVRDAATNQGLSGVVVSLNTGTPATTDATGFYQFLGLAPGPVTISVAKSGYQTVSTTATLSASTVTVFSPSLSAVTATTATLQGTVRDGTTGLPLSGALVALGTGASATTDSAGAYQITGIAAGSVSITVSKTGYQTLNATATLAGGAVVVFSPSLSQQGTGTNTATLVGKVVDAGTSQGISGATVKVGTATATTAADGSFSLPGLATGGVTINISAATYVNAALTATLVAGTNDLGNVTLSKAPVSATLSGRITDAASGAGIGGASVSVQGTGLTTTTDSTGAYALAGITQTQLTLSVAAPGYQSATVAVTLSPLADGTVNVTLAKVQATGGLTLTRVATAAPSFDPYSVVDIDVDVQNALGAAADVTFMSTVLDSTGSAVIIGNTRIASIAAGASTVELEAHLTLQPPGNYSVVVRGFDPTGALLMEGSAAFSINATTRMNATIGLDPPIAQYGTSQPVSIKANVFNGGNTPLPEGDLELTIKLDVPDTQVLPKAAATSSQVLSGAPATNLLSGVFDAAGNLYLLNSDRTVVKYSSDGQVSTLGSFPSNSYFSRSLEIDNAGVLYALTISGAIVKYDTVTRTSPGTIATNIGSPRAFTRDPTGNFYVAASDGLWKFDSAGGSKQQIAGLGMATPIGITRASDGNLYTANQFGGISRIDASGSVSSFATGFTTPMGVVQGPDGMFYVSATQLAGNSAFNVIVQMDGSGQNKSLWLSSSLLSNPRELRFDSRGNLFIASSGNNSIVMVPANTRTPQVFAKNVQSSPAGMAYDGANNLYVVSQVAGTVAKLDAADNVSTVATLNAPVGIATNAGNDVFISSFGKVSKRSAQDGSIGDYVTGLTAPAGLAVDASGVVYVAESSLDQITKIVETPNGRVRQLYVQSHLSDPVDVRVAANGDRYVLNSKSLSRLPVAGAPSVIASFSGSPQSLVLDPAGGFYMQDGSSVKHYDASNTLLKSTTTPNLAPGIALGTSGDVLVVEFASGNVRQIDSTGALVPTAIASFGGAVAAMAGDGAGGIYAAMGGAPAAVKFMDASHAVGAPVGTVTIAPKRLAYDPAAHDLYFSTTNSGLFAFNTIGKSTRLVTNARPALTAVDFVNGTVYAIDPLPRELVTYSSLGVQQNAIAGFKTPSGIAWNGSDLLISDADRVVRVPADGYPQVLVYKPFAKQIVVAGGYVYGADRGSAIRASLDPALTPVQRTVEVVYTSPGSTGITGLALRRDGALALASWSENTVEVIDLASRLPLASYAGMVSPTGLAVDASGNVFVSSNSTARIVRFDPTGKRSSVFSTSAATALNIDGAGNLYATERSGEVYRYTPDGTKSLVGRTNDTGSIGSAAFGAVAVAPSGDVFVTDSSSAMVRKLASNGNLFLPFASGISSPLAVHMGPDGGVYVLNQGSSSIVKFDNTGRYSLVGSPFLGLWDMAVSSSGRIYVTGSNSEFGVYDTTGLLLSLPSSIELGASGAQQLAMGSGESFAFFFGTKLYKESVTFTPGTPPPGTVIQTSTRHVSGLAAGTGSIAADFGSWLPPYAGEYSFALRPLTPNVQGNAMNALHVGPAAQGTMSASAAKLPAGDSTVGVAVRLTGADAKSVVKISAADTRFVARSDSVRVGLGADAAGNIYFSWQQRDPILVAQLNNTISRTVPGGDPVIVYQIKNDFGFTPGMLPVDADGNLYMVYGITNKSIKMVPLANTGAAADYVTMNESIRGMAIDPSNRIVVLTDSGVYRIGRDTAKTIETVATFTDTGERISVTTDGAGNIYVHSRYGGMFASVVRYAPDKSQTTIVHRESMPLLEAEGVDIAGDCANNLFIVPYSWQLVGQESNEEHTLVQINGSTGAASQVLDGRSINSDLSDMDMIIYDRFSQSLLIWTDLNQGHIYRVPAKCGAVSADLHVVFPANQPVIDSSIPTKAVLARADGSREYVWNVNDVSMLGSTVTLNTTLPALQMGQVRAVASEAFLTLQNSFVAGEIRQDIQIPTVSVDGMVDIAAATDLAAYPANTDVHGVVTLTNRDPANARGGNLDIRVVDAQGALVAVIGQQAGTVPAGASVNVSAPFNTGTILAGSYKLVATLTDAATGTVISTSTAGFDIVTGGTTLVASLSSDKAAYDPLATVTLQARLKNVSLNAIAPSSVVTVALTNQNGVEVMRQSRTIASLVPGALQDAFIQYRLTSSDIGSFNAQLTVSDPTVTSRSTSFVVGSTVNTGTGLTGTVTATPRANQGDPVQITATLHNVGNAAITGVPVTIRMIDPRTGVAVLEQSSNVSLAIGGETTIIATWQTSTVSAGTYIAAASATFGSQAVALGQQNVLVGALTPITFSLVTDAAPNTQVPSNTVTIQGLALPVAISITGGQYRIGSGDWTSAAGQVKAGDTLTLIVTSPSSTNTSTTATVKIGTASFDFLVKTAPDITPDPIVFTPVTGATAGAMVQSNDQVVSGIDIAVPISITGGEYRLGTGAWTTAQGTVTSGTTVAVRVLASTTPGATVTPTLTVSNLSAPFSVTTVAFVEDHTPEPFSFTPQTNVALGAVATSNTITVTGINVAVPISITGGLYKINSGSFTAAQGTVRAGDQVTVQQTASTSFSTTTSATLSISDVSGRFDVTTITVADVALALGFTRDTRLLVLISCYNSQNQPDTVCVEQRRAFLQDWLASRGLTFTLTTDSEPFRVEFRSGRYNTYWISGGAEKLKDTLVEEVREAAFRGESLIADGFHDDRNHFIDEVFGMSYGGQLQTTTNTVVMTGAFLPSGSFTYSGIAVKAGIPPGVKQASFDTASGPPAIISNNYGQGRGLLFAFDLVATLMAQPTSAVLVSTFEQSVDYVLPQVPATFTGSAYVPFTLTLRNRETAPVDLEVTASLAGFTLNGATPATTATSSGQTTWALTLAGGASATIEWSYTAPSASTTYIGTLTVDQLYRTERHTIGTTPISVDVTNIETALPKVIQQLQALVLTVTAESQARDRAVTSLQQAQTSIVAAQYVSAMTSLVDAVDQLDAITTVSVATQQTAMDRVMQEVGRRWYQALPVCPASVSCRP